MCQCYQIGGPFVAEDPDCPAHGAGGYAERLAEAEQRIAELEATIQRLTNKSVTDSWNGHVDRQGGSFDREDYRNPSNWR